MPKMPTEPSPGSMHSPWVGSDEERVVLFPHLEKLVEWRGHVAWDDKTRDFANSEVGKCITGLVF